MERSFPLVRVPHVSIITPDMDLKMVNLSEKSMPLGKIKDTLQREDEFKFPQFTAPIEKWLAEGETQGFPEIWQHGWMTSICVGLGTVGVLLFILARRNNTVVRVIGGRVTLRQVFFLHSVVLSLFRVFVLQPRKMEKKKILFGD